MMQGKSTDKKEGSVQLAQKQPGFMAKQNTQKKQTYPTLSLDTW